MTGKLALKVALDRGISPNNCITPPTHVTMDDALYLQGGGPSRPSLQLLSSGVAALVMIGHGIGRGGWISINTRYVFGRPK